MAPPSAIAPEAEVVSRTSAGTATLTVSLLSPQRVGPAGRLLASPE
jgi:hypothetical protein